MKKNILKIIIYTSILSIIVIIFPKNVNAATIKTWGAQNITDISAELHGSFNIANNNKGILTLFEIRENNCSLNGNYAKEAGIFKQGEFIFTTYPLKQGTTYCYRACIQRSPFLECADNTVEFTTKPAVILPVPTTEDATAITGMSAKLNGSWKSTNGNVDTVTVHFEYSTDPTFKTTYFTQGKLKASSDSISELLNGLELNTTYYFKIVTKNRAGTSYGEIKSFTTNFTNFYCPDCTSTTSPTVTTVKADGISDTKATLHGIGTPDLALNPKIPTTVYFRYTPSKSQPIFCNDIYVSDVISTPDFKLDLNKTSQAFYQKISNLTQETKYYYCAIISNKNRIAYGEVKSFTTPPCPTCAQTKVETKEAVSIGTTSAYLKGSYSSTEKIKTYFEYKEESKQINTMDSSIRNTKEVWTKINSSEQTQYMNSYGNISFLLSNLKPNTKYSFKLVAKTIGTIEEPEKIFDGNILSFTTYPENNNVGMTETIDNNNIPTNIGGFENQTINTGTNTENQTINIQDLTLGQYAVPPSLAVVRYHEGIEMVLVRQIMENKELAKRYGYVEGANLENFAWNLADLFARIFGYVGENGKEIRVTVPDMAAYQVLVIGNKLIIYEYFNNRIVNIQSMTESLRNTYEYEYYFRK